MRGLAIASLGQLGSNDPALHAALKDPDCYIRSAAAVALGRTDEVLADLRSDHERQRSVAADALHLSKDPRAIPALVEAMTKDKNILAARSLRLLGWKPGNTEEAILYGFIFEDVSMLAGLGPDAIPALADAVRGNDRRDKKKFAREAIAMMRDPQAVPLILKALQSSPYEYVRVLVALQSSPYGDIRDAAVRFRDHAQVVLALRQERNRGKKEEWPRERIKEIESMLRDLGERV